MAIKFNTPKTAINTTTRNMQNLSSDCPPCPEVNLTTADVEYTANGEYTVTPEAGYDGLTQVDITVSVPSDINNQNKTVTPTTSSQSVTADSGYSGLGTVTVDAVTSAIDANIAAGNIKKNVSILGVTGSYDPQPTLQAKTATPTTSQQVITPDTGNDGLSQVTISAVTASIDENIQPENILSGVEILGVTGTDAGYTQGYTEGYDAGQADCPAPSLESATETYTQNGTYYIIPSEGYDAINDVTVTVNTSNCPDWSSIDWTCSDVTASGLADEVAYSASVKNQSTWQNDTNLVFVPVTSTGGANGELFKGCTNLEYCGNLELTDSQASMKQLFASCANLKKVGNISAPNAGSTASADQMFTGCTKLKEVGVIDLNHFASTQTMFSACLNLTTIGGLINTSSIQSIANMFAQCPKIQTFPLFDTSNVITMSGAFQNCQSMTSFPQYDTSNVTDMQNMFANTFFGNCPMTTAPSLNTSKVISMRNMFGTNIGSAVGTLTTIPLYDCSKVYDVSLMFDKQINLTNLAGFTNLGKNFNAGGGIYNTLNLSMSTVLTKQSIMNVINNLAAPDSTLVNDATLKLSATSYALLDASDIAIATAKNWSVISA